MLSAKSTGEADKLVGPCPQLQPQQPCCPASQPLSLSGPEATGDHGRIQSPASGRRALFGCVNATLLVSSLAEKSRDIYRGVPLPGLEEAWILYLSWTQGPGERGTGQSVEPGGMGEPRLNARGQSSQGSGTKEPGGMAQSEATGGTRVVRTLMRTGREPTGVHKGWRFPAHISTSFSHARK